MNVVRVQLREEKHRFVIASIFSTVNCIADNVNGNVSIKNLAPRIFRRVFREPQGCSGSQKHFRGSQGASEQLQEVSWVLWVSQGFLGAIKYSLGGLIGISGDLRESKRAYGSLWGISRGF